MKKYLRVLTQSSVTYLGLMVSITSAEDPSVDLNKTVDSKTADSLLPGAWTYSPTVRKDPSLSLGATVSFSDSKNVLGKLDGSTTVLGGTLNAGYNYYLLGHEWRNSLDLQLAYSEDPVINRFIKAADSLEFESLYLYHFPTYSHAGPYARFDLQTSMFSNSDERPGNVTYLIQRPSGAVSSVTGNSLHLTRPFAPLRLQESLGMFYQIYNHSYATIEFRGGFAAREIFADHQLAVRDDPNTPTIEVLELQSHYQAGPELASLVKGDLNSRIQYKLFAEWMLPVVWDSPQVDNRTPTDLLNQDYGSQISLKIVDWMSLEYAFRALKEPQLYNRFQVVNSLFFKFSLKAI